MANDVPADEQQNGDAYAKRKYISEHSEPGFAEKISNSSLPTSAARLVKC
jgi:hypothetical protein